MATTPVIHRELHCRRKPRCHADDVAVLDVVVEHLLVDEVAVDAEPRDVVVAMLDVVLHEAHHPEDLLCHYFSGDSEWVLVTVHVDVQGDRQVDLDVLGLVHIVAAIAPDVERTEYKVFISRSGRIASRPVSV